MLGRAVGEVAARGALMAHEALGVNRMIERFTAEGYELVAD